MDTVLVRRAEPADLPRIAAIYDEQVRSSVATFDLEPPPPAHWEAKLADEDGWVAGYAASSTYRPRPGYDRTREVSVYLDEAARGLGTGRRLYDELLGLLRADGVHRVLAVVALPNDASEALHRACGFTRVGLLAEVGWKFERWVDTALYGLTLEPAPPADRG